MSAKAQPSGGAPARDQGALEFRLLGPLELRRGGETLPLGGARQRALLALLCLERGVVVSVDRIVDELWGESPPPSARHMVEVYVSKLRKLLGPDLLLTQAPGYLLELDPGCLDLARFEHLLAEGSEALAAGKPDLGAARLAEALVLWRGQVLADFSYEPFAQVEIARLDHLRQLAEEERIEAELALGRAEELVPEIEVLVADQPLRERRHGHLMLALCRAGRQADALAAYRRARQILVEELGLEPGPDLQAIERAILNQNDEAVPFAAPHGLREASDEERLKLVTVLVAELVDRDAGLDAERFSREVGRLGSLAQETLALHGASTSALPDGMLMGVFGHPIAHEDDALRAVRAAIRLQSEGASGIGISTGETLARAASVTGQAVGSARRLVERGAGAVLLDELTCELLSGAVSTEPLNGEPAAWRVLALAEISASEHLRLDAPLIGRDRELATLGAVLARTIDRGRAHLVTVVGEPGVGKSRLVHEFAGQVDGQVRFLLGRCLAFGEGATYGPLREALRHVGADDPGELLALLSDDDEADAVSDRLASLLEVTETAYPREEMQWAAQRLFAALAREQPLLLFLEDIHWAEQTFLDLVRHATEVVRAPMLVVCASRPELFESSPDWNGNAIELEALDQGESEELLSALSSGRGLSSSEQAQVIATAEGNPLFLEQLVALVIDRRKTAETGSIPASVQALLASRLDRLGPGEVEVLERSAIVGRDFSAQLVSDLLPPPARRTLDRHLQTLVNRKFIVPESLAPPFDRAFRFRHVLLQESAYRRIPKEVRAGMHEKLADLLVGSPRFRPADQDEIVGYHLEQACRYRLELGASPEDMHELAERGGEHLGAAGSRAFHRGDLTAAAKLLDRAAGLLPRHHPQRADFLLALGSALGPLGEAVKARAILDEVVETARAQEDERLGWRARLARSELESQFNPDAVSYEDVLEEARRAASAFEVLEDERGLALAWRAQAQALMFIGKRDAAVPAAEKAIAFANLSGDGHERASGMSILSAALLNGSTPVPEAIRRCQGLLAMAGDDKQLEAYIQRRLSALNAMRGNMVEAWRLVESSVKTYEELGIPLALASALSIDRANLHMEALDFAAAEHDRRRAVELLQAHGERDLLPTLWALLAATLLAQEKEDESERFLRMSESAGRHDWVTGMNAKEVRAELHARRGEFEQALRLARQALAHVEDTDDLDGRAHEQMHVAKMLFLAGRSGDAIPMLREARRLFEAKGQIVKGGLASAALRELEEPTGPRSEPTWLLLR